MSNGEARTMTKTKVSIPPTLETTELTQQSAQLEFFKTIDTRDPSKKPKVANNNTAKKEVAKKESTNYKLEEFFSLKDFRLHPVSERFKDELAMKWIEWADRDDARVLLNFFSEQKLRESTVRRWMETHKSLQVAHEYAKQRIAGRLLDGGLTKTYSESLVKYTLPMYHDSFKELEEWRAKIGEKVDGSTNITVVMDSFPSSDKVKPRVPVAPIEDKE